MRTILTFSALALTAAAAAPALADDDARCGNAPRDQWMSEDAIKAKGTEMGYDVRRVKVDDGCYELYALDKNGAKVELYLDPVTAAVVRTESDD